MKSREGKLILFALCLALIGYVLGMWQLGGHTSRTNAAVVEEKVFDHYELKTSLIAVYTDGTQEPTGVVSQTNELFAPSVFRLPDHLAHVAYAQWDGSHYVIYVADLDGSNSHIVAEQSIPEGSGALRVGSLFWFDDQTISYEEVGSPCGETGEPTIVNPTDDCSGEIVLTFHVNINTGVKEQLRVERVQTVAEGL